MATCGLDELFAVALLIHTETRLVTIDINPFQGATQGLPRRKHTRVWPKILKSQYPATFTCKDTTRQRVLLRMCALLM